MKRAVILALSLVTSCLHAATNDLQNPPIIIQVGDPQSDEPISVNNQQESISTAKEWLADVNAKFGGNDPVFLICRSDTPAKMVSDLRAMITATHPNLTVSLDSDHQEPLNLPIIQVVKPGGP